MHALAYEQIIIAGGDEDVNAAELFDWVSPLLAGIPGGRWMSCQIEFGPGDQVFARYRDGGSGRVLNLALDGAAEETRALVSRLPRAQSLTMLLLNDFTSQAVTLLDGIARWMNIYETGEREIAPALRLLAMLQAMTAVTMAAAA